MTEADLTPDEAYKYERAAAVACSDHGGPDHVNCRHEWNRLHPDDQVTEAEQLAFEEKVVAALKGVR